MIESIPIHIHFFILARIIKLLWKHLTITNFFLFIFILIFIKIQIIFASIILIERLHLFCREILADERVISCMNSRFIVWAGDVAEAEAYKISLTLGPAAFPFCAILNVRNSNQLLLVDRLDGNFFLRFNSYARVFVCHSTI